MLQQRYALRRQRFGRDAELARRALHQVLCQQRNVFGALAQRGQLQADDMQAVQQILTEQAIAHALRQILVRGGDDARFDLDALQAADAVELPV